MYPLCTIYLIEKQLSLLIKNGAAVMLLDTQTVRSLFYVIQCWIENIEMFLLNRYRHTLKYLSIH